MASSQKSVELVVRVKDESKRGIAAAQSALDRFAAAQGRAAQYRGLIQNQQQTAEAARKLAVELRGVGLAASKNQVDGFRAARREAKAATDAVNAFKHAGATAGRPSSFEKLGNATAAAAGVNGLARAMELAAANAARLNRIASYEGLAKAGTSAAQAAAGVNALGRALEQAGTKQAADATDALADALARISSASADATPKQAAAAQAAAAAQRKLAAALAAREQAAMEAARAERSLAAAQLSTDSTAEQLVAAQQRLVAANRAVESTTHRVTNAEKGLATAQRATARSMGLAGRQAAAWSTRQGRGPLGLRPYELQNLSYQINDVFTQIASGTPVMQVAAQQGGQFVQLFPKLGMALLRFLPIVGAVLVILSPVLTALRRVNNEAKNLREFDRLLTRSGEGASYTAAQLAALAERLDDYSGSLADARAALTEFVGDSVAPEYLERFGKTALDFARVMKVDVKEAAEQVSNAFTGNADAILALDDQLNFLTDSERAHVVALRQSKKDAEARTYAFDIFAQRYGETAEKMRGPWTQILNNFGSAWGAFVDAVNAVDFSRVKAEVNLVIRLLSRMTGLLPGARGATIQNAELSLEQNRQSIERNTRVRDSFARGAADGDGRSQSQMAYYDRVLERLRAENLWLEGRIDILNAREPGGLLAPVLPADTTLDPPAPAYTPPRNRDGGDAERLTKQREAFLESLDRESTARQFALSLIDQTERESRILAEIEQARVRAAELGLTLGDERLRQIRDEVGAIYDAEQGKRALELIDQARLELAQAMGEVESEEDFVSRKLRDANLYTSELDAATGELVVTLSKAGQKYGDILRKIHRINEATRQRAAAEKEVNDLTALRSDLMEQIQFYEDAGEGARADALREQLAAVNAELLEAVRRTLALLAAMDGPEAKAAELRMQRIADAINGIGETSVVSGRQINEMLAGGATNAVDQFVRSVAEGANVIASLRDAFLQFAADFLRQIAQMILKQRILNALQGGGGKGGGVGAAVATVINGLFRHDGGLVGQGGGYKPVALSAFAGATRYHTGGLAGFKPNEVPAVLTRGEEVLTMDDPRHRRNAGGKQGGDVKVVNVFDPTELLDRALGTSGGERVLLNFVSRNSSAVKAAIQ